MASDDVHEDHDRGGDVGVACYRGDGGGVAIHGDDDVAHLHGEEEEEEEEVMGVASDGRVLHHDSG